MTLLANYLLKFVLYTYLAETIYKEILKNNNYILELKSFKDILKDNTKYVTKLRLNEVRVYKAIYYKD